MIASIVFFFRNVSVICVHAWHNEAEVGSLASEILTKIVKLAKFMTFFIYPYFHSLEMSRYYRTFKTLKIPHYVVEI